MILLVGFTVALLPCMLISLFNLNSHDAHQTALLPFADAPEAARQLTVETGLVCEQVAQPADEPEPPSSWKA